MNHFDAQFQVKDMTETGSFCGYGSVYGNVDDGGDIVSPNAFAKSLTDWKSKGRMPALLWQHNQRQPIGAYQKMDEMPDGLYVEGTLALKTQQGKEAYELLKMNAISGLSIGYMSTEDDYNSKTGTRTIKSADLYEVSLVTFPMNDAARVSAVKTIEEIGDLTSAETYLRDVGGLSRREAKAFISTLKGLTQRDAGPVEPSEELKAIALLLEKRKAIFA